MKTVTSGRQLIDLIKLCYHAGRPPLLVGGHGVGKSEILEQASAEMDIGYICRDLSLMEPPDLVGLPKLDGRSTQYLPPAFLPTTGKGLLVFEELNRCPNYMRAPCLQLLTARTLHDYVLPTGWLPCAAINPAGEEYDVQDLDPALLSRFVVIGVRADREEWLAWAQAHNLHDDVVRYVGSDGKIFDDTNPRAWKAVSDLLHAFSADIPESILEAAIAGVVGNQRAVAFRDFRRHGFSPPSAAMLLCDYGRYRKQIRTWVNDGRTDLLGAVAHSIKLLLQPQDGYGVVRNSPKQWKALGDLLADLPPDLTEDFHEFLGEHDYDAPTTGKRRGA
jgi:hypothetical protein